MKKGLYRAILAVALSSLFLPATFASAPIANAQNSQKGYISFTFDDGEKSQYSLAYPVLKEYDFPATAYITTDWIGIPNPKFMNWSEVRTLQNEGDWEIGNHSANHDQLWKKKFSARYIQKDIERSQAAFAQNGIEEPVSFAPPYGKWDGRLMKTIKSVGFTSSRRAWIGKEPLNCPSNINPWALEAVSLKKPRTFASVKKYIDRAAQNKCWLVFVIHGLRSGQSKGSNFSAGELQKIAEYVNTLEKEQKLEVVTVRDGVEIVK